MKLRLALVLVCLASISLGAGAGETVSSTFTLPPLRIGDAASYTSPEGSLLVALDTPTKTFDRAGVSRDVVPVRYEWNGNNSFLNLSLATLRAENFARYCPVSNASGCRPWVELLWTHQGLPGAFGATLLQGRAITHGDQWIVTGDCRVCAAPLAVRIDPPTSESPPGTAFVAVVSFNSSVTIPSWLNPEGRLHMGTEHAYPLKVEQDGTTFVLTGHTDGGSPLAPPTTNPAYQPPLTPLPYEDGRPVEGTPYTGELAWSDARNKTGHDPSKTPGVTFWRATYAKLSIYENWRVMGQTVVSVLVADQPYWEIAHARQNDTDLITTYRTGRTLPTVTQYLPLPQAWSATEYARPGPTGSAITCPRESVPLWDVTRFAMTLPYLHEFRMLSIQGACSGTSVGVVGGFHAESEAEYVQVEGSTGYLGSATYWVGPAGRAL